MDSTSSLSHAPRAPEPGKGGSGGGAPDGRPPRRSPRTEHELYPRHGSWLDHMPEHATASCRLVLACLEYGALQAWQDRHGNTRFYLPEEVGGYLVVGIPSEDVESIDLTAGDPARGDPDALQRAPGAAWVTLLPDMMQGRSRPQPALPPLKASTDAEAEE